MPKVEISKKEQMSNSNLAIVKRFLNSVDINAIDSMAEGQKRYYIEQLTKVSESLQKNKLEYYNKGNKVHKKQLEFHKCHKRKRGMFGGNRTGKTVSGGVEAVWSARGNHPYRKITKATSGWVVSITNEVQRDVAQKEILRWLNPDWIIDVAVRDGSKSDYKNAIIDYIIIENVFGTQSVIGFKSCDQGRLKFQGTSKDWIWFDEEPPYDIYEECLMRIMDTEGHMWFTMTPLMGLTYIYEMLYLNDNNDPEIWCLSMEWNDNPWLSESEIKQMEATLTDEQREARQYGRAVALTGLIYRKFDPDLHVLDAEYDYASKTLFLIDKDGKRYSKIYHSWYDNISIDPGYTNPTSIHFYARDDEGTIYVLAELYESYQMVDYHSKNIRKVANWLNWPKTNGGYLGIIDSAANQKTAASEQSVKEKYAMESIYLADADKSVDDGIQTVMMYIEPREHFDKVSWPKGKPSFFILNVVNWPYKNTNMIREFKKYRWKESTASRKENSNEGPRKLDDHAMDDSRYYIKSLPPINWNAINSRIKIKKGGYMSPKEKSDLGVGSGRGYKPILPGGKR